MTKDEALRMALEALEGINKLSVGENAICLPAEIDTAMDAIKEALAQPEIEYQERILRLERALKKVNDQAEHFEREWYLRGDEIERLKAQPKQEPVAGWTGNTDADAALVMLDRLDVSPDDDDRVDEISNIVRRLATPPQRKPLTDDEIADIVVEMNGNEPTALFWRDLAHAIEAAHGIKENT